MSRPKSVVMLSFVGLAIWAAAGCMPRPTEPVRLVAKERSYLLDVPLPVGFRIVDTVSEDRFTSKRRLYARHVYQGKGDTYSLRSFYIEQMPRRQWRMAHAGNVEGTHTLRFEKERDSCTITISQSKTGWGRYVDVQVMVLQEEE